MPNVPDIADINISRLSKKRDEKILEEIIKPKDDLINKLYQDKLILEQIKTEYKEKEFDMRAEDSLTYYPDSKKRTTK